MPKKKEVTRDYSFSDSHLVTTAYEKQGFIDRDIAEFATYNIDAAVSLAFKTDTIAFQSFRTDEDLLGIQEDKTAEKETAAEELKTPIRIVMSHVDLKYDVNSARYKRFGTIGMDEMDDEHLLICGTRVVSVATDTLADFASVGLTQAMIDDVEAKTDNYKAKLKAQADAVAERDIFTEDRIEMGNALYKKMSDYCEVGKSIWLETDEAKYNDYVIYDSQGNVVVPPPPPEG